MQCYLEEDLLIKFIRTKLSDLFYLNFTKVKSYYFCRTPRLEAHSHSDISDDQLNLVGNRLPTIMKELKAKEYAEDVIPDFQRIAISGEETSGVSKMDCVYEPGIKSSQIPSINYYCFYAFVHDTNTDACV